MAANLLHIHSSDKVQVCVMLKMKHSNHVRAYQMRMHSEGNTAMSLCETDMFSGHVRRMLALLRHKTLIVHLGLSQHIMKNSKKYGTVDCGLETSEGDSMHYILNVTEGISSYRYLSPYRYLHI